MANFRQVHVRMWKDEWFLDLPPELKLLFVYLFTNERASVSGIYELPLKVIMFETGLDKEVVEEGFAEFEKEERAYRDGGVVWVVNLRKYHETSSPKLQTRLRADIDAVRVCELKDRYLAAYGIDTVSEAQDRVSIPSVLYMSKSKSNSVVDSSLEEPPVTPVKELDSNPPQERLRVLAEVCLIDPDIPSNRKSLENTAVQLSKYDAEQILERYRPGSIWYEEHWKGLNGQPPTLKDIQMTMGTGRFKQAAKKAAVRRLEQRDRVNDMLKGKGG